VTLAGQSATLHPLIIKTGEMRLVIRTG